MAGPPIDRIPLHVTILPMLGIVAWLAVGKMSLGFLALVLGAVLLGNVVTAVHHAEVVALWVGEPYGTLVLALAVTVIEVGLIISIMLSGKPNLTLLRDSVQAVVMLELHGLAGVCIVVGALRERESEFQVERAKAFLAVLIPMATLVMVLPNYLVSAPVPYYSLQLAFVSAACLGLYIAFLFIQTGWHRAYFLPVDEGGAMAHARPSGQIAPASLGMLFVALFSVVLLAKSWASTRRQGAGRRCTAIDRGRHHRHNRAIAGNGRGDTCSGTPSAAGQHQPRTRQCGGLHRALPSWEYPQAQACRWPLVSSSPSSPAALEGRTCWPASSTWRCCRPTSLPSSRPEGAGLRGDPKGPLERRPPGRPGSGG
jgi:hypothetical protein